VSGIVKRGKIQVSRNRYRGRNTALAAINDKGIILGSYYNVAGF
jgi:hypothetical protein